MHLGDTYSFRERKRANTSLECPKSNNLECTQTDTVPDPNVRLQCLKATEDTLNIIGCYDPHAMFVLLFFLNLKGPLLSTMYFLMPVQHCVSPMSQERI